MRKILILAVVCVFLSILFFLFPIFISDQEITFVTINNKKINAEIADTDIKRYNGLSYRENLCIDCAMLFVFADREERTFVMRNMYFPLDIIWIDGDKIVAISKNLLPEGKQPIKFYHSDTPVNYVLEVNAGLADKYDFKIGDKVNFN